MRLPLVGLLLWAACCGAADLQSLYDRKQFFDLRDALAGGQAPPFFRVAVACSFNDQDSCLGESKLFLDSKPSPGLAGEVYGLLCDFHFAHGRWSEALAALEGDVARRGDSEDPDNLRELFRLLARHGPVTVERSAHSSIHVLYKNAHVPFSVNGRPYHGYLDTGAGISMLSESAAKQLGLPLESARFRFHGAAGSGLNLSQVAVAERFVIGNLELRNFPFIVIGDRQQPFAGWGAGKRCVLGIQVLLAARTMTWKGALLGATLELARPTTARALREANVCFDGTMPLAAAEYQGHRLTMFVDTGMGKSVLHASFAAGFPELVNSIARRTVSFEGIDGGTKVEAAIVPAVSLRIGGHDAGFRRMAVYLKGHSANSYDGMFGNDLTGKAHEFTIDFEAMRLTMR